MFRFVGLLLAVISSLTVQGCAGPSLERQPLYKSPPAVKEGSATIYIYRQEKGLGSAVVERIDVDGETVGYLPNGGYFRASVSAGQHKFTARRSNILQGSFGDGDFKLTVESGKVYFIEQQTRIFPFLDDGQSMTPIKEEIFRGGVRYYLRWALVPQAFAEQRMVGGALPSVRLAPKN